MKCEKILTKLQFFVWRNWIFVMKMYKQEIQTVHDKKCSINLFADANLLVCLLAASPSLDNHPRSGHQEEPLDWRVRESRSKRRSWGERRGSSHGCTTWVVTMGSGQETENYWGKDKHTTSYSSPESLAQTRSSLQTHWYTPSVPSPAQPLWGRNRLCNLLRAFPSGFSIISA